MDNRSTTLEQPEWERRAVAELARDVRDWTPEDTMDALDRRTDISRLGSARPETSAPLHPSTVAYLRELRAREADRLGKAISRRRDADAARARSMAFTLR